jgi:hypothetical protein
VTAAVVTKLSTKLHRIFYVIIVDARRLAVVKRLRTQKRCFSPIATRI